MRMLLVDQSARAAHLPAICPENCPRSDTALFLFFLRGHVLQETALGRNARHAKPLCQRLSRRRGAGKECLGQSSALICRQKRTATAQGMQKFAKQHTSQLHKAGNGMAGSNAHTMPADGPNVWRGAAKSLGEVVSSLTQQARQANARQGAAQAVFKQAPTSSRQASLPGAAQACSRKPNNLMPGEV